MKTVRFSSPRFVRWIAFSVLLTAAFVILAVSPVVTPPVQADGPCAITGQCPSQVGLPVPTPVVNKPKVAFQKGDVFAGVGNGLIKHFGPTGTLLDTLNTTHSGSEDTGMCFDSAGNLYATVFEANTMSKFDKNGTLLVASFGSGFNQDPESCVVDNAQNIYVGQADGTHKVLKFNTSGTLLNSYTVGPVDRGTDWIELGPDQCTIYYNGEGTTIRRFNVCTNTVMTDFVTGLPGGACYALRIRPNGEVMTACSNQINRLTSSGTIIKTYLKSAYAENSFFFALNLDPDGTSFWTGGFSTGNIYKIDIATGTKLASFNAGISQSLAGLSIFGEITGAGPGPAPVPTPIAPSEVPEGDTLLLLGGGLGGLATWIGWQYRKVRRKADNV